MKKFVICFSKDCEMKLNETSKLDEDTVSHRAGDLIEVTEDEMFRYLETAHHEGVKLAIYSAKMICDLS